MIKMKALKAFGGRSASEGHVKRGREFSVQHESRAADLEQEGLAYRIETRTRMPPMSLNKMEPPPVNRAAVAGPLDSVGGATGAAAPAPSSPPVRQPRRRRSSSSEAGLLP